MSTHYTKAIDILMSPTFDPRKIAIDLAKRYPDIFIDVARPPWMDEVDMLLRASRKIDAIKLWRHHTGSSLKEAKDEIDTRAEVLGL